jgi:hypothetical protein
MPLAPSELVNGQYNIRPTQNVHSRYQSSRITKQNATIKPTTLNINTRTRTRSPTITGDSVAATPFMVRGTDLQCRGVRNPELQGQCGGPEHDMQGWVLDGLHDVLDGMAASPASVPLLEHPIGGMQFLSLVLSLARCPSFSFSFFL